MIWRITVTLLAVGLFAGLSSGSDSTSVASVRTVELTADMDSKKVRVSIAASGEVPVQHIESYQLWIDDHEVPIPSDAYNGADNPNPASIIVQESRGAESLAKRFPTDISLPLTLISMDTYAGTWSILLFFEENNLAFAFVASEDDVCRPFDPRFKDLCAHFNAKGRDDEPIELVDR